MPFSLKHIPQWHALEIKGNGKNRPDVYAEYQQFMESIPERVQPDDYTYLIPQKYFSRFMNKFGFITTMTQTEKSILGNEEPLVPVIAYEPKHLDKLKIDPYPFQKIGAAFLVSVEKGIIGDEMGLGR